MKLAGRAALLRDAFGSVPPIGDLSYQVVVSGNVVASMELYWRTITVGGDPLHVAVPMWLAVDVRYRDLGLADVLFRATQRDAAREAEWGVTFNDAIVGYVKRGGYFAPEERDDPMLLVAPLTGLPQQWPSGRIDSTGLR